MQQRSVIAHSLDALLVNWKSSLPNWLQADNNSLREAEWAAKQKLVLELRYLNARAILHRPFLTGFAGNDEPDKQSHVDLCLEAARRTISILHDAYQTRHYFRTWWYNSTYALYAGMIVLYVIMFGQTNVSFDHLIQDVIKSRDVLRSMEEASVARRSADLLNEVLEVAQTAQSYTHQGAETARPSSAAMRDGSLPGARQFPEALPTDDVSELLFPHSDFSQDPGALFASITDIDMLLDFTQMAGDNPPVVDPFLLSDHV